jgi:hypothetical protein
MQYKNGGEFLSAVFGLPSVVRSSGLLKEASVTTIKLLYCRRKVVCKRR